MEEGSLLEYDLEELIYKDKKNYQARHHIL
jgi:hypothetical protein